MTAILQGRSSGRWASGLHRTARDQGGLCLLGPRSFTHQRHFPTPGAQEGGTKELPHGLRCQRGAARGAALPPRTAILHNEPSAESSCMRDDWGKQDPRTARLPSHLSPNEGPQEPDLGGLSSPARPLSPGPPGHLSTRPAGVFPPASLPGTPRARHAERPSHGGGTVSLL